MPNHKKPSGEVKRNSGVAWKESTILKLKTVSSLFPGRTPSELSEAVVLEWCDRVLADSNLEQNLEELGLVE